VNRVDWRDVVEAHVLALHKVQDILYDTFIISSNSPFQRSDRARLLTDAPGVLLQYFPSYKEAYDKLGWSMFKKVDRVYDIEKSQRVLGFNPKYNFQYHLNGEFKEMFSMPRREHPYNP
jgi:UDP-glucose 4-epimerase